MPIRSEDSGQYPGKELSVMLRMTKIGLLDPNEVGEA